MVKARIRASLTMILGALLLIFSAAQFSQAQIRSVTIVSVPFSGSVTDGDSGAPSVSEDGSYVAFRSNASNVFRNDTNGVNDVFLYRQSDGDINRISENFQGSQSSAASGGDDTDWRPIVISSDGNYTAFLSEGPLALADSNGVQDVYLYNLSGSSIARASEAFTSPSGPSAASHDVGLSDDGNKVAYSSTATDIISLDLNGFSDVFLRDVAGSSNSIISREVSAGVESNADSLEVSLSRNGSFVAFTSSATNLLGGTETNGVADVYLADRTSSGTPLLTKVSIVGTSTEANGASFQPAVSSGGEYVAFVSNATNFVSGDTNGFSDVFLRDVSAGTTELISKNRNGGAAAGNSKKPAISADGRYVAFISDARNIVAGDTNGIADAFVRDRQTGVTLRVNLTGKGAQLVRHAVTDVDISPDGLWVAFTTKDSALSGDTTNEFANVFLAQISPVLTPDTPLPDPPTVSVTGDDAFFTLPKFSKVSLKRSSSARILSAKQEIAEARRRRRLDFRYVVTVRGTGSVANEFRRKLTKRNTLSFKNLPSGSYTGSFRVAIRRGSRTVARTGSSPSAGFSVS